MGIRDGWCIAPFVRREPQQRRLILCWAERKGIGGDVRVENATCGSKQSVLLYPVRGLVCVRVVKVRVYYV